MGERKLIPYDPHRLSTDRADLLLDGEESDFKTITSKDGFVGFRRMMVERDGKVLFDKIVIDPSEGVFVLPVRVTPDNQAEFLLTNEWKDVLGKRIPNIPQGRINRGETAAQAAIREVREETGHEPTNLVLVGKQIFDSAYMSLEQPYFLATVPYEQERAELQLDGGEDISKLPWMNAEQVRRMGITDGKTTIGLSLGQSVINPSLL